MSGNYSISDYCSIRNNRVMINGKLIFTGDIFDFTEFSLLIYRHFAINYPKFHKMDYLSKLGFLSSELLLRNKNLIQKYPADKIGIILMNASSSLVTDHCHQDTIADKTAYFPSPSVFVYTLPNVTIGEICIRNNFCGEGNFFIMEKFNPSFLVNYISYIFSTETIQCCVTGWVEIDDNEYDSIVFLVEKTSRNNSGFANFEVATIQEIYDKMK